MPELKSKRNAKMHINTRSNIFLFFVLFCIPVYSQNFPVTTGSHRVYMNKADTIYEFYAVRPEKSFKPLQDKLYYWYSPDTLLITKAGYSGRVLHGSYKEYYSSKSLKVNGNFSNGLMNGKWSFWYPDGRLQKNETWKNGLKNGYTSEYNQAGGIITQIYFDGGKKKGMELRYNPDAKKYDTTYYKHGNPVIKKVKQ